ncbi:hypothetical protein PLICRDRAFT_485394 [Plicaturopsis crispa FD-325 SS-3]|nr:hypothetical protein PLICRDRAFT_485394 [Plicaturopsis crispa FD-325 SS-3]
MFAPVGVLTIWHGVRREPQQSNHFSGLLRVTSLGFGLEQCLRKPRTPRLAMDSPKNENGSILLRRLRIHTPKHLPILNIYFQIRGLPEGVRVECVCIAQGHVITRRGGRRRQEPTVSRTHAEVSGHDVARTQTSWYRARRNAPRHEDARAAILSGGTRIEAGPIWLLSLENGTRATSTSTCEGTKNGC